MFGKSPRSSRPDASTILNSVRDVLPSRDVSPRSSNARDVAPSRGDIASPRASNSAPTRTSGREVPKMDEKDQANKESSLSPRDKVQRVLPLQRLQKTSSEPATSSSSPASASSGPPPLPRDLPKDVALRAWFIRANELRGASPALSGSPSSPLLSSVASTELRQSRTLRRSLGELEVMLDDLSGRSSEGADELFEFSSEDASLLNLVVPEVAPKRDFAAFLPVMRISHANLFDSTVRFDQFLRIVFGVENVAEHEEHWIVRMSDSCNIVLAMSSTEIVILLAMEDVSENAGFVREKMGPEIRRACELVQFGKTI